MTGQAFIMRGDALHLPFPDNSVDLIVTSPPYFALRSYEDAGAHYDGQIGSEPTPREFLEALWKATEEMKRVISPKGSIFVNLGDKYAGSGGHNNAGIAPQGETGQMAGRKITKGRDATRRNAPNRYNKSRVVGIGPGEVPASEVPRKSLMGFPWRYAIGCVDHLGLILREDIVWSKPNGLPESVKDRMRRSHEYWFHFTKDRFYFAATEQIREPHKYGEPNSPQSIKSPEGQGFTRRAKTDESKGTINQGGRRLPPEPGESNAFHPDGKLPGSVWTIATTPLTIPQWAKEKYGLPEHFAAFPTEWPRRLILGFSPPAGIVLDPFGGTGTTALVARALDRVGISVDLSADYCRLARWRIFESTHASKATARTWGERQGELL